jgi:hypothetical protein
VYNALTNLMIFPNQEWSNSKMKTRVPKKQPEEKETCEFCGVSLEGIVLVGKRRKFCSESCRNRASQGRRAVRLEMPISKRYSARLKFTSQLYFD